LFTAAIRLAVDRDVGENGRVRISAKADYAVRAMLTLTAEDAPQSAEAISRRHDLPIAFLQKIFTELRQAQLVTTHRGRDGGHRLARDPGEITVADILRAVEGPLADVRGQAPEDVVYGDGAEVLQDVWIALRANMRAVLEHVTLADLQRGRLPRRIASLAADDDARARR
jgi:Rrf2 family protein